MEHQKQKQKQTSNVVPFVGEFYAHSSPPPVPQSPTVPGVVLIGLALVAGIALGAITTYQDPGYQELQQLKNQSSQLSTIKKEVCK